MSDPRHAVPRTDVLMTDPRLVEAAARLGRAAVKVAVRQAQEAARQGSLPPSTVADHAVSLLPESLTSLRPVINATGVVVHTNLGRAPLSAAAREAVQLAAGCTDVEFDLATGSRAARGRGARDALAAAVPAAGDVHVVNNNAAAILLAAMVLGAGREVVVSRGELVEIGDGFRIPDLVASCGARLREVGTTNRTHPADYASAVGPDTGFILKVHPSNYVVSGFAREVEVSELTRLGVPVVVDIGSGLLRRHPLLPAEPDADSALRAGAALVTASGDKLLGGPQCGLIAGRAELVTRLRRHPAARALRVDKLTLAALEATLRGPATPVEAALDAAPASLTHRAEALARALQDAGVRCEATASTSTVGGGGAPGVELPSAAVAVAGQLAGPLRTGRPPVIGRAYRGRYLLDLRAVSPAEDEVLLAAVLAAAEGPGPGAGPP